MKIIKFTDNTTGEISYFEGTCNYVTKLGDLERYNDVAITFCNNPMTAKVLSEQSARNYVEDWNKIFVGSTIEAISVEEAFKHYEKKV